jgi:hypothetical protein
LISLRFLAFSYASPQIGRAQHGASGTILPGTIPLIRARFWES